MLVPNDDGVPRVGRDSPPPPGDVLGRSLVKPGRLREARSQQTVAKCITAFDLPVGFALAIPPIGTTVTNNFESRARRVAGFPKN